MRSLGRIVGTVFIIGIYSVLALGSAETSPPEPLRMEYRVTGQEFDLTYNNCQGNTEQISGHRGDWTYECTITDRSFFAYVSAQNQRRSGTIVAEVYVNGQSVERSESTGEFVIATASTSVR